MKNISLGSKFWVEKDGEFYLGKGRVQLLKAIKREGSISRAAKSMSMSYKKAWESVNAMNLLSDKPLVHTATGGSGGGGTIVTQEGENAIALYEQLMVQSTKFIEEQTLSL